MISSLSHRFVFAFLLGSAVLGFLAFSPSVHAADPLPWTKPITFWSALPELEKECHNQGGTSARLCYNKSNDTFYAWDSSGCKSGYTPALWCKAPPTAAPAATTPAAKPAPAATPAPAAKPATGGTVSNGTNPSGTVSNGTNPSGTVSNGTNPSGTVSNGSNPSTPETLKNPLKFNSLPELMDGILQAVVQLGSILLVFMLVWVGFLFVAARGNPEQISSARSALLWTLIGGLILLGAEAISKVIEATVSSIT